MEEKIKINITKQAYEMLLKDMELFGFTKNDGSLNKNQFYNVLIHNYHLEYGELVAKMADTIRKRILEHDPSIKKYELMQLVNTITSELNTQTLNLANQTFDKALAIKPTKITSATFKYIDKYFLQDTSASAFFRSLIASYLKLSFDARERIIFKQEYQLIAQAIAEHKQLFFTVNQPAQVSPYKLTTSKEELFNYLLATSKGHIMSYRLAKIKDITILNEPTSFTPKQKECFEQMIEMGPQYSISNNKRPEIIVRFTPTGQDMYTKMYLHRPKYTKKVGDLYYFKCSPTQLRQYISRFGHNAVIVEPIDLRDQVLHNHRKAFNAYRDEVNQASKHSQPENITKHDSKEHD